MRPFTARILDGSAIGLSGLCLAHCLALPIAAAVLPLLGAWAEAEWLHILFVAIAGLIAAVVVLRQADGRALSPGIAGLAAAGILLLIFGVVGPNAYERLGTMAGSLSLAAAHIWNWRSRSDQRSGRRRAP
ncbi:MAG: hypothetical protein B7Z12_21715 [Caulobacter vibrioides]|uniref:MerC domain-containing protein n=1 Tax=Caulobacter vibrioides TaxID=155892 RepID=A0A258CPH3_CAUVI|nr:MAG: hypothetical protein B7Z12_21715 [Caulobacter vibrioides]